MTFICFRGVAQPPTRMRKMNGPSLQSPKPIPNDERLAILPLKKRMSLPYFKTNYHMVGYRSLCILVDSITSKPYSHIISHIINLYLQILLVTYPTSLWYFPMAISANSITDYSCWRFVQSLVAWRSGAANSPKTSKTWRISAI